MNCQKMIPLEIAEVIDLRLHVIACQICKDGIGSSPTVQSGLPMQDYYYSYRAGIVIM